MEGITDLGDIIQLVLNDNEYYQRAIIFNLSLFKDVEVTVPKNSIVYKKYGIHKIYFRDIDFYTLFVDLRFLYESNFIYMDNSKVSKINVVSKGPSKWLKENNNTIKIDVLYFKIKIQTSLLNINLVSHRISSTISEFKDINKRCPDWTSEIVNIKDNNILSNLTLESYKKTEKDVESLKKIIALLIERLLKKEVYHVIFEFFITRDGTGYDKYSLYIQRIQDICQYFVSVIGKEDIKELKHKLIVTIKEFSKDATGLISLTNTLNLENIVSIYDSEYKWLWDLGYENAKLY